MFDNKFLGVIKKYVVYICWIIILIGFSSNSFPETGSGMPLKYISSCELDFNNDDNPDIAFLIETTKGRELIVLMRTKSGYNTFVVSNDKPNMFLSCHFGKTIKETSTGKGKGEGKIYEPPGTYIQLTQPEGSSVVYFWDGKGFKEVWTSD
ncbi:MAG: hypothetical protein HY578_10455 [Nitrospinae bacterium]|nr:hypothetical protein [Nitrospinota bacterium]